MEGINVRLLIAAIIFAATTTAMAQTLPGTMPWTDAKGNKIGTATLDGLRMYLRDTKGELVATVVVDR
jgi:hypothetical protein